MENIDRYKLIKDSFKGNVTFDNNKIQVDGRDFNLLDGCIPNFIDDDLDPLTNKISKFYNDVKFPNYDNFEDYPSLLEKGDNNSFANKLDKELNFGIKILELGCGTGQMSLFLARGNRFVHGVDISNGSLLLGENFRRDNNINRVYFMKMDVFDLKFKKDTFDFTISNGVLHHTKDAKKAFKNLVEVTKPGGFILIGLYHKYGRLLTNLKQKLAKVIGKKIFLLDQKSLQIKTAEKRNSWVTDQFLNPHETSHTPKEVLKWFEEANVDFVNLIPHLDEQNKGIFEKRSLPSLTKIREILMAFNPTQIHEGGFFIMIGQKKDF